MPLPTAPAPGPDRPDPALLAALRTEVGRFRAGQVRRRFDPAVHVGVLTGPRASCPLGPAAAYDAGLRADVVAGLLGRLPPGGGTGPGTRLHAWLTRPGVPEPHDLDLAWLAATSLAFGMHGLDAAGFYAVTRTGWLDVRTGDRRVWKRLRL